MSLTGTDRGTNATNTGGQSTLVVVPASNLAVGSMAVLCVAYDNSKASGVDPYSSIADSVGNTWTSRQNVTITGGVASDGVSTRIFTSLLTVALTTSDSITVTYSGVTVARAWALHEATGSAGVPTYVGGNTASTHQNTTLPTITTDSIPTGDMVIGVDGQQGGTAATITQDGDSTNGSWSAQQSSKVGSGASGMTITSQRKVVTGTGTQTYNPTYSGSGENAIAWISVNEVVAAVPSITAAQSIGPLRMFRP